MTRTVGRLTLVGVLALVAAVCLLRWADAGAGDPAGASPVASAAPRAAAGPAGPAPVVPAAAAAPGPTRPVALRIPSIDVRTPLIGLGLQDDGSVEVPQDPARAGWFRLGPPPGDPGSSVILGHVDSISGPAVFARLDQLAPGDAVVVRLDDGRTVRYRVRSVRTYANADFPARRVYAAGGHQLNLVTCGGAYDAGRGGYQANVVVNARLV